MDRRSLVVWGIWCRLFAEQQIRRLPNTARPQTESSLVHACQDAAKRMSPVNNANQFTWQRQSDYTSSGVGDGRRSCFVVRSAECVVHVATEFLLHCCSFLHLSSPTSRCPQNFEAHHSKRPPDRGRSDFDHSPDTSDALRSHQPIWSRKSSPRTCCSSWQMTMLPSRFPAMVQASTPRRTWTESQTKACCSITVTLRTASALRPEQQCFVEHTTT
jgi:hypothetical protein